MTNEEIKKHLQENADPQYKEFHRKLIPTVQDFIGVRMPVMKKLAKEIAKGDWRTYLQQGSADTYEEKMVRAIVIGNVKTDFEEIIPHIKEFVPLIDNWAVCDCFCASLKHTKKYKPRMWEFLNSYRTSNKEFELRCMVIMMMDYYLDDEYLDRVIKIYDEIRSEDYYVRMGIAWGLSFCFIKHRDKTLEYFKNNSLDKWTLNRAIQKTRESYRVSPEDKDLINKLKR